MSANRTKSALEKLRSAIEGDSTVDSETRTLFDSLNADDSNRSGLMDRAQQLSTRVSEKSPHLEPAVRELLDALRDEGI
ncbi:DUF4404 family protein [Nocardia sp. CA-128927]|uniref:DUF4404 family protein n=1 Tax=Nocardia sp. CA-128927 TaxID=3239975 RepID=UPI003D96F165